MTQDNSQSEGENKSLLAKSVFLKWEKLRIVYNCILLITLVIAMIGARPLLPDAAKSMGLSLLLNLDLQINLLSYAFAANICFFAGPLAEQYFRWLGVNSPMVTRALFLGGVLISIPLVFPALFLLWTGLYLLFKIASELESCIFE